MFFSKFPKIEYPYTLNETDGVYSVTDILKAFEIIKVFDIDPDNYYVDYIVKDGEKPEHIADRVYGNPEYHWIVLIANKIVDPYKDWPLSTFDLDRHIEKIYSGVYAFFDPTETRFSYSSNENIKLPQKDSFFRINQKIKNITRYGYADILEYNQTLKYLRLNITSGNFLVNDFVEQENEAGTKFKIKIKRLVTSGPDALNYFKDDYGNIMDPYSIKEIISGGYVYSEKSIANDLTKDFPLKLYTNENESRSVVSNKQYEYELNDRKRRIRVLKVEYVSSLINSLEKVFNT